MFSLTQSLKLHTLSQKPLLLRSCLLQQAVLKLCKTLTNWWCCTNICKFTRIYVKTAFHFWKHHIESGTIIKLAIVFHWNPCKMVSFMFPKLKGVKSQNSVKKCHAFINTITKIAHTPSKTSPDAFLPAAANRNETMQNAYHLLVLHHHLQIYAHLCKNYVWFLKTSHRIWNNYKTCNCFSLKSIPDGFFTVS